MPSYMYPPRAGCSQMPTYPVMPYTPSPYTKPSGPSLPPTPREEIRNRENVYTDPLYTQGYLAENIGKYVKIEFLIGTNMLVDREGVLKEVGISFVVIQEPRTDDLLLCDIYSIKFVTFLL